ncbi:MAG: AEC family transporter [Armatimonadota bacterium]
MNIGSLIDIGGTVLSVFLLLFVGYGMKKLRILQASNADILNTVVIYITLPAFVFNAIYSYRQPISLSIIKVPIVGILVIAVVMLLAYLIGRLFKFENGVIAGLILAAGFGNTGFLGYPVVQAAFTEKSALFTAVLYDAMAMALPLYTIGMVIATCFVGEKFDRSQIKRVLLLPQILAIPISMIFRPFTLPEPLLNAMQYLGNGTVPLVMISLGLSLSARSLKGYTLPVAVACILKLAILPFLTFFAVKYTGISGTVAQVMVLEAGMPTAMMAGVLLSKFGKCGQYVAGTIFISTLLSLVTIPLILMLVTR